MTSAAWALQKALHGALWNDADLLALLSGPQIFDHVPRRTARPFVTLGTSRERDWSTGDDVGFEHDVTIDVWLEGRGREQAQSIVDAVHSVLHDADLQLDGHRLVNLHRRSSELRRAPDGRTWRGVVSFRAVTEVAG